MEKEKLTLFCFPGLGFDHRIFERLQLPKTHCRYLDWIEPQQKESIEQYARRIAEPIRAVKGPVALLGHSFGGMMSLEIARFTKVKAVVLLSSVRNRKEIPLLFRCLAPLGLHTLFSRQLTLRTFPFWAKYHGYANREEKELFHSMVSRQSNTYLQWALKELSKWQGTGQATTQVFQIHGDQDKTFPLTSRYRPDKTLTGAGHFMVYRKADEVSRILNDFLQPI